MMTILVLAIWSVGIAVLIAVAVFRGRNRHVIDRSVKKPESRKDHEQFPLDFAVFNDALLSGFPSVGAYTKRARASRIMDGHVYGPLSYTINLVEDDVFAAASRHPRGSDVEIAKAVSPVKPPNVLTH